MLLRKIHVNQKSILMFMGLGFWYLFSFLAFLICLGVFTLSPSATCLAPFPWDGQQPPGMSAEAGEG